MERLAFEHERSRGQPPIDLVADEEARGPAQGGDLVGHLRPARGIEEEETQVGLARARLGAPDPLALDLVVARAQG